MMPALRADTGDALSARLLLCGPVATRQGTSSGRSLGAGDPRKGSRSEAGRAQALQRDPCSWSARFPPVYDMGILVPALVSEG